MISPTIVFAKKSELKITSKKIIPLIIVGVMSFLYTATATEAYKRNLTLSSIIISLPLSMVVAVGLSKRLPQLREDHPIKVYKIRFAAATVMIISGLILSLSV